MTYYDYKGKYDELIVQDAYHRDSVARTIGIFIDDTWNITKRLQPHARPALRPRGGQRAGLRPAGRRGEPDGHDDQEPGQRRLLEQLHAARRRQLPVRRRREDDWPRSTTAASTVSCRRASTATSTRPSRPRTRYALDPNTGARLSRHQRHRSADRHPGTAGQPQGAVHRPGVGRHRPRAWRQPLRRRLVHLQEGRQPHRPGSRPYATFTPVNWTYTDRNGQSKTVTLQSQNNTDAVGNTVRDHQPAAGSTRSTRGWSSRRTSGCPTSG